MTSIEKELCKLFLEADEDVRKLMLDMATCFAFGGEPFFEELHSINREDRDKIKACVVKWAAKIKKERSSI